MLQALSFMQGKEMELLQILNLGSSHGEERQGIWWPFLCMTFHLASSLLLSEVGYSPLSAMLHYNACYLYTGNSVYRGCAALRNEES